MISLFATANVAIIDSDTFSNSVYSKESARNRLDEIIVPAIETGIMAHKKNQLTMSDKTSESGVEINKEILNWIIGLYGKYPQRFGMQVTDFNVFLK